MEGELNRRLSFEVDSSHATTSSSITEDESTGHAADAIKPITMDEEHDDDVRSSTSVAFESLSLLSTSTTTPGLLSSEKSEAEVSTIAQTQSRNDAEGIHEETLDDDEQDKTIAVPVPREDQVANDNDGVQTTVVVGENECSSNSENDVADWQEGKESTSAEFGDQEMAHQGRKRDYLNLFGDEMKFMTNFDPAQRMERKKQKTYTDEGIIVNKCDCLIPQCSGCHYPCQSCGSRLCGQQCRVRRGWNYEEIIVEGRNITRKWSDE